MGGYHNVENMKYVKALKKFYTVCCIDQKLIMMLQEHKYKIIIIWQKKNILQENLI